MSVDVPSEKPCMKPLHDILLTSTQRQGESRGNQTFRSTEHRQAEVQAASATFACPYASQSNRRAVPPPFTLPSPPASQDLRSAGSQPTLSALTGARTVATTAPAFLWEHQQDHASLLLVPSLLPHGGKSLHLMNADGTSWYMQRDPAIFPGTPG